MPKRPLDDDVAANTEQVAPIDELWRRIVERDLEGRWGSRSITRSELEEWSKTYEPPTDEELATYDTPA